MSAVKGPENSNKLHVDLTRQCGNALVTKNTVLHRVRLTWKHPRRGIEVVFQVTLPFFFSTNRALRAVKGTKKGNASYVGLTWHCGKSLVTTSAVLRRVQLT